MSSQVGRARPSPYVVAVVCHIDLATRPEILVSLPTSLATLPGLSAHIPAKRTDTDSRGGGGTKMQHKVAIMISNGL